VQSRAAVVKDGSADNFLDAVILPTSKGVDDTFQRERSAGWTAPRSAGRPGCKCLFDFIPRSVSTLLVAPLRLDDFSIDQVAYYVAGQRYSFLKGSDRVNNGSEKVTHLGFCPLLELRCASRKRYLSAA